MEIRAKKSGRFAYPDPAKKPIILTAGRRVIANISPSMLADMVDYGWVEVVVDEPAGTTANVEKQEVKPSADEEPEKEKPKKRTIRKKKKDE